MTQPFTQVVHLLAPTQGAGLEQVVAMLSVAQRPEGVHVILVLTPEDAVNHPFVRQLKALEVDYSVVVVPSRSYSREYREINAIVSDRRPSVLHTHGYRADLIGLFIARRARIPMVSTVHGFTGATLRIRLNELIQCLILRRADAVIAVSQPIVQRLARTGVSRSRIHYVPNGFLSLSPELDRHAARARLGISSDRLIAGWVGRLSIEKGADVMLEAIASTPDSWQLTVVGDGILREELRRQAAHLGILPRVFWPGPVPGAGALFKAFDAYVLSSRTEGTPIALLEAMHAGVPIIATRVGGVPDVVGDAEAILVSSDDPDAIARGLTEIETDPISARERSSVARQRLLERFGKETWVGAIQRVYSTVLFRRSK